MNDPLDDLHPMRREIAALRADLEIARIGLGQVCRERDALRAELEAERDRAEALTVKCDMLAASLKVMEQTYLETHHAGAEHRSRMRIAEHDVARLTERIAKLERVAEAALVWDQSYMWEPYEYPGCEEHDRDWALHQAVEVLRRGEAKVKGDGT